MPVDTDHGFEVRLVAGDGASLPRTPLHEYRPPSHFDNAVYVISESQVPFHISVKRTRGRRPPAHGFMIKVKVDDAWLTAVFDNLEKEVTVPPPEGITSQEGHPDDRVTQLIFKSLHPEEDEAGSLRLLEEIGVIQVYIWSVRMKTDKKRKKTFDSNQQRKRQQTVAGSAAPKINSKAPSGDGMSGSTLVLEVVDSHPPGFNSNSMSERLSSAVTDDGRRVITEPRFTEQQFKKRWQSHFIGMTVVNVNDAPASDIKNETTNVVIAHPDSPLQAVATTIAATLPAPANTSEAATLVRTVPVVQPVRPLSFGLKADDDDGGRAPRNSRILFRVTYKYRDEAVLKSMHVRDVDGVWLDGPPSDYESDITTDDEEGFLSDLNEEDEVTSDEDDM